ncbi:MAG: aldo/keto reductase [Acidimicrobiales bacterium]|jgi:aryl-alcohol dehydrogenase-like predicted oxidoreductase
MKYIEVGGARMSAVGLGTWQFGSTEWGYGADYAGKEAGAIVRRALDVGITLFDTAEIYGFGRSERILGRALQGRRDEAFLATKILPVLPLAPVVLRRARGSTRRLGVDSLDLYQLHQPNPVVPLSATMPAFAQLMDEGLVRHAGVSNYSLARWQEAEQALGRPVLSNQVRFNLVDRRPEHALLPWAQANDRLIIAYSPIAQGLLSGRYDTENRPVGIVRAGSPAFHPENLRRVAGLVEVLRDVAGTHGVTPSQVALAWLVRRPNVVVIPGASSVAQVEANAAAADIALSDDEDLALVAAADAYQPVGVREVLPDLIRARFSSWGERLAARTGRGGGGPGATGPGATGAGPAPG